MLKKQIHSNTKQILALSTIFTLMTGVFFSIHKSNDSETFLSKNVSMNLENYANNSKEFLLNASMTPRSTDCALYFLGYFQTDKNKKTFNEMNIKNFDPR